MMMSRHFASFRFPFRFTFVAVAFLVLPITGVAHAQTEGGFATPPPPPPPPSTPDDGSQLVATRPRPLVWRGNWRPTLGFDLGGETGAGRSLLGVDLGIGAVGYDRFLLEARVSAHLDIARQKSPSPYLDPATNRILFGVESGYRLRLGGGKVPVYLVPRAGLYAGADLFRGQRGQLGPAGNILFTDESNTRWSVLPTMGVGLQMGYLELVYRYHLDAQDPRRSMHGLAAGFRF
jgi:hypothetical protein